MVVASLIASAVLDTKPNLTRFALSIAVTQIVLRGVGFKSKAFKGTTAVLKGSTSADKSLTLDIDLNLSSFVAPS